MKAMPMDEVQRPSADRFRVADAFRAPGLVSWLRVPLAAAFPLVASNPPVAIVVLIAAGVSDIVDGWLARRFSMATPTGAVLDGVTDKIFAVTVAVTLLVQGHFDVRNVVLLSIREIGELPLLVWLIFHGASRRRLADHPKANGAGKVATVMQFGAVALALLHHRWLEPVLWGVALVGGVAALAYWRRALVVAGRSGQQTQRHGRP